MTSSWTIETRDLSKIYGRIEVVRQISLALHAGEIVAFVGENGAGKSTFARMLTGAVRPDGGQIFINGSAVTFHSPRDALKAGVAFIPQELAFVPELTVAENVLLGIWPNHHFITKSSRISELAEARLAELGLDLRVNARMRTLTIAEQQVAEIAKALMRGTRLLVLDEPTSALSQEDSHRLASLLGDLASRGTAIAFISHRMDEAYGWSDRLEVFRNGERVFSSRPRETTQAQVITAMLGDEHEPSVNPLAEAPVGGKTALRVTGLTKSGHPTLDGVTFSVSAGEVVGMYGVRGCGIEVLADALTGRAGRADGEIETATWSGGLFQTPRAMRDAGLAYVPPDRKRAGLVLGLSIERNLTLCVLDQFARWGVMNRKGEKGCAEESMQDLGVVARRASQPVVELSGGNQQKVLLGSRLIAKPRVLVLHEPTRGVDVGARVQIHRRLRQLCGSGVAVLLLTADVEEAVVISDRLFILRDGRLVDELLGRRKMQSLAIEAATRKDAEMSVSA